MAKEICISTTPHETRLAILEDDQLAEIYYERENEYTLAGSIYKGRVTRVLPGMQSSFVDVGLERDAFLYVTDFLEEQEDSEEYETSGGGRQRQERAPQAEEPAAVATGEERKGRREGRRGEGRRGERSAERPVSPAVAVEQAPVVSRRNQAAEERAAATAALQSAQPAETDREEKGDEETPEGTRRWRGRRGRRRGGMRAGVLGSAGAEAAVPQTEAVPFATPERGAPGGFAAPKTPDVNEETGTEGVDLQASAQPRRERGQRRGRAGQSPVETPAAETPSRERQPAKAEAAPAGGAIVLPGESLSKYGAAPAAGAATVKVEPKFALPSRPVNYTAPKPSTLVEVSSDWDGGMVMPGETLSRHKSDPTAVSLAAAQPAPSFEASAYEVSVETAVQAAETHAAPETVAEAMPGVEHAEHEAITAEAIDPAAQTARAIEESTVASLHAAHEGEADEYEPEDGAAAGQAAPSGTSELRFSQLFGGGESKAAAAEESRADQQAALSDAAQGDATRSTLDAGSERANAPETAGERGMDAAQTDADLLPEFEEHFEQVEFVGIEPSIESEEQEEATLPLKLHAVGSIPGDDGFTQLVDQLQGFAPGFGLLEEEVIDEDEYDFDPIHAHTDDHDLEDLEEETMDGDDHPHETAEPEQGRSNRSIQSRVEDRVKTRLVEDRVNDRVDDEDDDLDEEPAVFALEEIDGEEDEAAPVVDGEPQRRERGGEERGRRGGRNGRRRGVGGAGAGGRRQSAQTQDLPIISDLLKQGQEILVQIAKEPIAKKGARITSHIALPGRFLVFMPTVSHVGVSRKIASDEERQRLKRILVSERGDAAGGFIVRTAAEGAGEDELRADLRFLISLWTEIKQRSDTAKAPALIYHDLNLVERILRDQVSANFSTIWVDTEQEYERIVRFLNRFQPSLVRRVKLYTKETPLFEHFGIQEEITKALKSKVWLKSGGSIVINQTEALVAIDINTGKYVGKTARLEDTIVKTNLDAIPEIVRQIRLRDLGGIIVIDFIDMDERKNRHRVLAALEEAMKADRAPSKVLQFNDFGLVAITRKRVKQSLERTLSVQCETCAGTGMVKSPITVCNEIFIELRKMQKHLDGKDVMLRVNPEVVKQLKSSGGRWISEYEEMVGKTIIIKSDPALHPEQFDIH